MAKILIIFTYKNKFLDISKNNICIFGINKFEV